MTKTQQDNATAQTVLDPADMVAGYFHCWNAVDGPERATAIARAWAADAVSVDPLSEATGHDAIQQMIAGVFETYPGHSFRQVGGVDSHHNLVRWGWEMLDRKGAKVLDGIDVAVVDDSGRIAKLAGFFGAAIPGGAE